MSNDKIIRCITSDGAVVISAAETSNIVFKASKIHRTSPVATAALGRLLTACSIMGAQLKQKDASITLRVNGDNSDTGAVIAVSDSRGNVRGYVQNAGCPTEYYENGKLNVGKAVGRTGVLNVMRDYGSGEPYIGMVPLVSGEIAEDITSYYATSEQIPTVCALGVLLEKESHEVLLSGGFLLQLLPGADESTITQIEKNIEKLEPVTTMLAKGLSIKEICDIALEGFEVEVLDEMPIDYICACSREKVERAFMMMSDEDIRASAEEKGHAEASCHFCNKIYRFNKEELEELIEEKHKNNKNEKNEES
ncbi:MAG: Hsp33 family molecular chaperone HslO [Clostridia bacterium]|nr:Hsp33 family molecular chaperone HslO [Clostridia bacterium]